MPPLLIHSEPTCLTLLALLTGPSLNRNPSCSAPSPGYQPAADSTSSRRWMFPETPKIKNRTSRVGVFQIGLLIGCLHHLWLGTCPKIPRDAVFEYLLNR